MIIFSNIYIGTKIVYTDYMSIEDIELTMKYNEGVLGMKSDTSRMYK